MKFSLLIKTIFLLIPTIVIAESISYTCKLSQNEYAFDTIFGKDIIEMSDPQYHYIASPGDPALHYKTFYIKVPNNIANVTPIMISNKNVELKGIYDIFPVPPNTSGCGGEDWGINAYEKIIINGKNINVYEKDSLYPRQCFQYLDCLTEEEKDSTNKNILVKYIRFNYTPFQYNPVQKKLIVTNELVMTFTYDIQIKAIVPFKTNKKVTKGLKEIYSITGQIIRSKANSGIYIQVENLLNEKHDHLIIIR